MPQHLLVMSVVALCFGSAAAIANTHPTDALQREVFVISPSNPETLSADPAGYFDVNAWLHAGQKRQYALLLDNNDAGRLEIDDRRDVYDLLRLGNSFGYSEGERGVCDPARSPGSQGVGQDCAPPTSRSLKGSALQRVVAEQTALRAEIAGKGRRFKDMDPTEREALLAKQDRLLELLAGRSDIEQLSAEQRDEVYTALKAIDTAVARVDDDRMVCERVKVVGSNRPQNKCMTVGQRRRMFQSR